MLHLITSLKRDGKGAIILPHGVLFRGGKEAELRKALVKHGLIKGIIRLPDNLFYGTGIPASILVIDKEHAHSRDGIFMIDASNGFIKDGNKNRLRSQDIRKIVDVFNGQVDLPHYSRTVPFTEIANSANNFELNMPRYIDSSKPYDFHDLGAHLHGGIPNRDLDALKNYWSVFPSLRQALFISDSREGYSSALIDSSSVEEFILCHEEFVSFERRVEKVYCEWYAQHKQQLWEVKADSIPRDIIDTMATDLLMYFCEFSLLDPYDIYQEMMEYWDEVMQDDLHLIATNGWTGAVKPRSVVDDKERKLREAPDLVVDHGKYKMDLVSPDLIVTHYFAEEKMRIEALQADHEAAVRELENFLEEHSGEGGILAGSVTDKGTLTKSGVNALLKTLDFQKENAYDHRTILMHHLQLIELESEAQMAVEKAQTELDSEVIARYSSLNIDEIKILVIEDKWFGDIQEGINEKVYGVVRDFAKRVRELEERYARSLRELEGEVRGFETRVEGHLENLGVYMGASTTTSSCGLPPEADDRSAEPHGRMRAKLRGVPHDWEVSSVGAEFRVELGKTLNAANDFGVRKPYLNNRSVRWRHIDVDGIPTVPMNSSELRKYRLEQGDLLVCEGGEIGRCAIWDDPIPECYYQNALHRLRPKGEYNTYLMMSLLQLWASNGYLSDYVTQTSIAHLSNEKFKLVPLPVPPPHEQHAIAQILSDIDAFFDSIEELSDKIRAIKQGMMQLLLTGDLRLGQASLSPEQEQRL